MKRFARGWQCKNEFYSEQVIKKRSSLAPVFFKRLVSSPAMLCSPVRCLAKAQRGLQLADECYICLLDRPDLHEIFAITALRDGVVVQELLMPVREVIGSSLRSDTRVVDDYFYFIETMFKRGIFEYSFNMFDNFGYNARGDLRLIEVGEFSLSKQELISKIKEKKCMPYSLKPLGNRSVIECYCERHEQVYSLGNLDRLWCTA